MMKRCCILLGVLLVFLFSCSGQPIDGNSAEQWQPIETIEPEQFEPGPYVLRPGDEITIYVWRHEELTRTLRIGPSGTVFAPLIGEIPAIGLTVAELQRMITANLSKYIVDPQVDINVTDFRTQKVYVLGEVRTPSVLQFTVDRRMLLWEAISKVGGFTDDANKKHVLLVKRVGNEALLRAVNIQNMFNTGRLTQNLYLHDSDIVYVPKSKIANVENFLIRLNNILNPFLTIERGIVYGPEVIDALTGDTENSSNRVIEQETQIHIPPD